MRARTAVISLACATGLVLSGCSTGISGVPEAAGGGSVAASSPQQTTSASAPDSGGSSASAPDSGGSSDNGSGGDSGLPSASGGGLPSGIPGLPSDLPGGIPTELGSVPGLDTGCLTVAGLSLSISVLFLSPLTQQSITQDDVDTAFADMDKAPAEVQHPVQVLHEAAMQMVNASPEKAQQIANSDRVQNALDKLSDYTDNQCGGS